MMPNQGTAAQLRSLGAVELALHRAAHHAVAARPAAALAHPAQRLHKQGPLLRPSAAGCGGTVGAEGRPLLLVPLAPAEGRGAGALPVGERVQVPAAVGEQGAAATAAGRRPAALRPSKAAMSTTAEPADLCCTAEGVIQGSCWPLTGGGGDSSGAPPAPLLAVSREQRRCAPHAGRGTYKQQSSRGDAARVSPAPADSAPHTACTPAVPKPPPAPCPPRCAAWPPARGTCGSGTSWRHRHQRPPPGAGSALRHPAREGPSRCTGARPAGRKGREARWRQWDEQVLANK